MTDQVNEALRALAERAIPFLRDEAENYEDDGSNEPLELAREIESLLASSPSDESALSSASLAFDGGAEAPHPSRGVVDEATIQQLLRSSGYLTHSQSRELAALIVKHLQAALPAVPEVDWRDLYRLKTAMRYMDASPQMGITNAYRMADEDIARHERNAAAPAPGAE